MLHALKEFSRAIPRGEASLNLRRVFYRKKFRNINTNFHAPDTLYHSQHAQDRFIDTFLLHGKRNGVFVDVGAYDGVALSKPNPAAYGHLTQNRNCVAINCGVGARADSLEFLKLPGDLDLGSGFIQYFDDSSIYKDNKFIERVQAEGGEIIKVPVRCFNELLESSQIARVDYLSIDTEGADLEILRSIDFDSFDIQVISIENSCFGDRIITFLSEKGYDLKAVLGSDEIYMKKTGRAN